jgi:hypothetical protein
LQSGGCVLFCAAAVKLAAARVAGLTLSSVWNTSPKYSAAFSHSTPNRSIALPWCLQCTRQQLLKNMAEAGRVASCGITHCVAADMRSSDACKQLLQR